MEAKTYEKSEEESEEESERNLIHIEEDCNIGCLTLGSYGNTQL